MKGTGGSRGRDSKYLNQRQYLKYFNKIVVLVSCLLHFAAKKKKKKLLTCNVMWTIYSQRDLEVMLMVGHDDPEGLF